MLLVLEKDVTFSFEKVLEHTGSSVRCGDTTDNLCVDERSRECNGFFRCKRHECDGFFQCGKHHVLGFDAG